MKLATVILLLALPLSAATTYYVDFDLGNDANNGTATNTAWQHAPDDPGASGVADGTTLGAGDILQFKAGTLYKGLLYVFDSGTAASPLTIKGTGWGTGNAIVEGGSELSVSWTNCAAASDCFTNANYASIWYSDVTGVLVSHLVSATAKVGGADYCMRRGMFTGYSYYPIYTALAGYRTVASTTTNLVDAALLEVDNFWNGASVIVHCTGDDWPMREITGFTNASAELTFTALGDTPYTPTTTHSIYNHPALILGEQQCAVVSNRLYAWPPGNLHPTNFTWMISTQSVGIYVQNAQNIIVEGFHVRHTYSASGDANGIGMGIACRPSFNGVNTNIVIRSNTVYHTSHWNASAGIHCSALSVGTVTDILVHNNTVSNCLARGQQMSGNRLTFRNNDIVDVSHSSGFWAGAKDSQYFGNRVWQVGPGNHADALAVYQASSNVTVSSNIITGQAHGITLQNSSNLFIFNNVLVNMSDYGIISYGGCSNVWYVNNTLVGSAAVAGNGDDLSTYHVYNNILPAGIGYHSAAMDHGYNLYTVINTADVARAEVTWTNLATLFNAADDYRLIAGSGAIGTATNATPWGLTTDRDGKARLNTWDIGAYEFSTSEPRRLNIGHLRAGKVRGP